MQRLILQYSIVVSIYILGGLLAVVNLAVRGINAGLLVY